MRRPRVGRRAGGCRTKLIEASRLALLGDHKAGDDLWIYSYGSLMWDPGFHFAEVRLADRRKLPAPLHAEDRSRPRIAPIPGADAFARAAGGTLPRPGVSHRGRFGRCRIGAAVAARDVAGRLFAGDGADDDAAGPDHRARLCLQPLASRVMSANCRLPRPRPSLRPARAFSAPTANTSCNWRRNCKRWRYEDLYVEQLLAQINAVAEA